MKEEELKQKLQEWVNKYETIEFIKNDPIQIPHRYSEQVDIEISAFVTSWVTYGRRNLIIDRAKFIDDAIFGHQPHHYIMSRKSEAYKGNKEALYRLYTYSDFSDLCACLFAVYSKYKNLEEAINSLQKHPLAALQELFGSVKAIPNEQSKSASKKLCLFLRWMCRCSSPVDFGLWKSCSPRDLIIPLDTHVHRMALELGLTTRKAADKKTALEITEKLKHIFPDDPIKGDFALFGYGEDKNN